MGVHYAVRAEVVDIRTDRPRPTDVFLVDTNVWLWTTYAVPSQGAPSPVAPPPAAYGNYFKRLLAKRAKLCRCGLSLAEMAHFIENAEYKLFEATNPAVKPKEYRHNFPDERARITAEIESAWSAVKLISSSLDLPIDDAASDKALAGLSVWSIDGYDLFILAAMARAGVTQVLTDDGDYCTVPGIQVFTANRAVIDAASAQGRLVGR